SVRQGCDMRHRLLRPRKMTERKRTPAWSALKRDSTAIVVVAFDHQAQRVVLVAHRIFQPSAKQPLDFEATVERTLLDLTKRFAVRSVRFDRFQMVALAQRLQAAGVRMEEFPQSLSPTSPRSARACTS